MVEAKAAAVKDYNAAKTGDASTKAGETADEAAILQAATDALKAKRVEDVDVTAAAEEVEAALMNEPMPADEPMPVDEEMTTEGTMATDLIIPGDSAADPMSVFASLSKAAQAKWLAILSNKK